MVGSVAILGTKSQKESSSSNDTNQSSQSSSSNETSSNSLSSDDELDSANSNNPNGNSILDVLSPGIPIISGDRGTENIGLAVFKGPYYIGKLSAIETLCYSLIENEVNNFTVCIDNPYDKEKKIYVSVSSLEPTYTKIDISKQTPEITVVLNLSAKTLTGQNDLNFSDAETLNKVNDSLKNYLTSIMKNYLYKTSREYNSDINSFYKIVKQKFLIISDYQKYNWKDKYSRSRI